MGWFNLVIFTLGVIHSHCLFLEYHQPEIQKDHNCNKGQVYWCQNITTAVSCSAFKHCVQAVWEREIPIEKDKSEVCQICLNMVKQARDQLRSNETQNDLKAVLEGSCMLIPITSVREGCKKLMDDFAVQIVDVLSSQMNPQVVCSVAGLCNNAVVHELEREYYENNGKGGNKNKLNCNSCQAYMNLIQTNIRNLTPQRITEFFSELCRSAGSYSDGCTALIIEHSSSIYSIFKENINQKPVCSLLGVCKELYHNHNKAMVHEVLSNPSINVVTLNADGDLPCELCTELVVHLKNILIANTTEEEFKQILNGLCNQMKTYKDECLNIIEEYYGIVYNLLVSELDGQVLCKQIGICPGILKNKPLLRPLLPSDLQLQNLEVAKAQLPVERLNPLTILPPSLRNSGGVKNKELCSLCEYFLHFVQQEITLPSNEKKIREAVMKGCDQLPKTISEECDAFVETYMNAFIALLANRIDPSQVCPRIGACPGADFLLVEYKDKPTCPLCLLAMEELMHKVKNNTANEINDAIDNLCLRDEFPNALSTECVKFINDNRRNIVDMMLAEFTPQESCVFVDLCVAPDLKPESVIISAGNVETNEISDISDKETEDSNKCAICEFIITKLDEQLKDKKTQDEIKSVVYKVCTHLPKTLSSECKQFIKDYADFIIELLVQEAEPKEVCTLLNLCGKASALIQGVMKRCLVCELMMEGLRTVLTDRDVDKDINKKLEKACEYIPQSERTLCLSLIEELAPQIENALRTLPVGPLVCRRIHMCESDLESEAPAFGGANCLRGSTYWCRSTETAAACRKVQFCQETVWKAVKPRKSHNKGRIVILH